jgi:energy-converting hydrogenase B subunit D
VTWFWVLDVLCLVFVLTGAVPDVAHAEVVVGAIALPVLYLVAIGKCRTVVEGEDVGDE